MLIQTLKEQSPLNDGKQGSEEDTANKCKEELYTVSNPLLRLVTGEKKANTLYSTTLNLALQALCLLLPRFCTDTMSHSRGCISDATMSVTRMPKPVWT